jgi:hypothetical protein
MSEKMERKLNEVEQYGRARGEKRERKRGGKETRESSSKQHTAGATPD